MERKIIQKLKFDKCTNVTRQNEMMISQPSDLCALAVFLPVAGGKWVVDVGQRNDTAISKPPSPRSGKEDEFPVC